jgi:hypothetical protein
VARRKPASNGIHRRSVASETPQLRAAGSEKRSDRSAKPVHGGSGARDGAGRGGLDIDEFQMLAIREAFRQAYSGHLAEARNISQNR